MTMHDLPADGQQAIDFAKSEFVKGSIFWPRLLVRCLEASRPGKTLVVVLDLYMRKCDQERDVAGKSWCDELRDVLASRELKDANRVRVRASEIWNDTRCRTLLCRGVTRLFGAAASIFENDFVEYEIELTRAIGMLTASDGVRFGVNEFTIILQAFQDEFEK